MADKKIPKVMISSTLEDLGDFRKAARDAISRLGWVSIDCGYWAAGGKPPLATCLEKVDEAGVVLAIVAHRHGWTPPINPMVNTRASPGWNASGPRAKASR